ncbi:MAG: four helix bundle protein [Bryobacteraceae bacterium]|jgi:four helix bundle protein
MATIRSYRELNVYQAAFEAAMRIFELIKQFPVEERYSMVGQIRRCSRSLCANIGEGWRKRRYKAHFVSKLSDAESEAEETRVWLEFALRCRYLNQDQFEELDHVYDNIIGRLVRMLSKPDEWSIR